MKCSQHKKVRFYSMVLDAVSDSLSTLVENSVSAFSNLLESNRWLRRDKPVTEADELDCF